MPKPSFTSLKANHYSSDSRESNYKNGEDVYKEIGYDIKTLMAQNGQYENTCAVRMSLAFLKSGVYFGTPISRLQIKDGPYKGRHVGTGAKTLADELRKPTSLGKPLTGKKAEEAVKTKKGVIFFHRIYGSTTGHIDLIEPVDACHSSCHFDPKTKEIWFWPLD